MTNQVATRPAPLTRTPDMTRNEAVAYAEQLADEITALLPGDAGVSVDFDFDGVCFGLDFGDGVDASCGSIGDVEDLAVELAELPASERIAAAELVFD